MGSKLHREAMLEAALAPDPSDDIMICILCGQIVFAGEDYLEDLEDKIYTHAKCKRDHAEIRL